MDTGHPWTPEVEQDKLSRTSGVDDHGDSNRLMEGRIQHDTMLLKQVTQFHGESSRDVQLWGPRVEPVVTLRHPDQSSCMCLRSSRNPWHLSGLSVCQISRLSSEFDNFSLNHHFAIGT